MAAPAKPASSLGIADPAFLDAELATDAVGCAELILEVKAPSAEPLVCRGTRPELMEADGPTLKGAGVESEVVGFLGTGAGSDPWSTAVGVVLASEGINCGFAGSRAAAILGTIGSVGKWSSTNGGGGTVAAAALEAY